MDISNWLILIELFWRLNMTKKLPKINLTLLKKLVSELEATLAVTEEIPTDKDEDAIRFITELSKSSGLAAAVAQEASALVKDMYKVSTMAQQPPMATGEELLSELFGGVSGGSKNRN